MARPEPGPAGHPAQSSDRRSFSRPITVGPHSLLVSGPYKRAQAEQRQIGDPGSSIRPDVL
jgi:hypothetical protein